MLNYFNLLGSIFQSFPGGPDFIFYFSMRGVNLNVYIRWPTIIFQPGSPWNQEQDPTTSKHSTVNQTKTTEKAWGHFWPSEKHSCRRRGLDFL